LYSLIFSLSMKGLVLSSSVSTLRGRKRIVRLTCAGREVLGLPEGVIHGERHESAEHWYWKMRLADAFRECGYEVEIEKNGADLAVEKDGKRIALEIETGQSDVEANITRDLSAGFDEVVVAWTSGARVRHLEQPGARSVTVTELLRSSELSR